MQIAAMKEYAARRGWDIIATVEDIGSGAKDRPKRQELFTMAKRREIDVVLVWRLDRWGRSSADLISSLEELTAIGITFASVTEGLDLSTPTGRALVGFLSVFAQFERDLLKERVRAGIVAAKKRGKVFGRPATARAKLERIEQFVSEGLSKRQISKRLGISRSSVSRTLHGTNGNGHEPANGNGNGQEPASRLSPYPSIDDVCSESQH
jgi:DNA invertase Pin-like site-specific DNA recombinase